MEKRGKMVAKRQAFQNFLNNAIIKKNGRIIHDEKVELTDGDIRVNRDASGLVFIMTQAGSEIHLTLAQQKAIKGLL